VHTAVVHLRCENKVERSPTELGTHPLIGFARRHDEQPGVVVGAIAVFRAGSCVLRVLIEAVASHEAGEMIE
jgi:hypothetical protein